MLFFQDPLENLQNDIIKLDENKIVGIQAKLKSWWWCYFNCT